MSSRVIELIIRVNDQTSPAVAQIQSKFLAVEQAIQRATARMKNFASARYRATISLIDRVSEPGSKINSVLKNLAGKAYRLTVNLADSASNKLQNLNALAARLVSKTYTITVNLKDNVSKKLGGLSEGIMMGAGTFAPIAGAAGVGFGVANAVQAYMDFEKSMSRVQAVRQLDKDSDDMKALTQQAKDLGAQTAWTRSQVAEAQYYEALAGFETPQILAATPHMLNLASAGNIDLGSASDMVTDAMTAFGLKATDTFTNASGKAINAVEYFADMSAKLQASSNTDLLQAREAFKYGAPTIGAMFADVEGQEGVQMRMEAARQMMIMTGLMANAGIKGSMAGTGINTLFNRLAGENRNTHFAEQLLGLEHAANGQMLMPLDFIKGFQKKAREGMSVDDFYKVAEELSGEKINADTRRKLDSVIKSGIENGGKLGSADIIKMSSMLAGLENAPKLMAMLFQDIDALEAKMTDVEGTAKDMADIQLDNLAGDITILGSAWDAFQQSLVEGQAAEGLRNFVQSLTEIVSNAQKVFSDGIQISDFGNVLFDVIDRLRNKFMELDGIGSVLAGGALMGAIVKIGNKIRGLMTSFRELRTAATSAGTSTSTSGRGVSGSQSVGTMTVTANVVNINGRVGGAAGSRKVGNQSIIDNYNRTKATIRGNDAPTSTTSRFSGMRSAGVLGAGIAATFGVMDVMNVKEHSKIRLQEADDAVKYHENQLQTLRNSGASQAEIDAQIQEVNDAKSFRQRTEKLNRDEEFTAGAGATGSVVGTAIGAALGSAVGPVGTMLGGMIGGMIGDAFGQKLAEWKLKQDESSQKSGDVNHDYFSDDEPKSSETVQQKSASMSDFRKLEDEAAATAEFENLRGLGGGARRRQQDAQEAATKSQTERFQKIDSKLGISSPFKNSATLNATQDFYKNQQQFMKPDVNPNAEAPTDTPATQFMSWLDGLLFNKAAAHELDETQLAQQTAMERGEVIQPEMPTLETPESPFANLFDGFNLPEIDISGTFDSITTQISEFVASLPELFSGAFDGLGEMISSGLESASSVASGALDTISTTFTSTKDAICTAWAEVPTFFSGLFDGLGGVASSAGSAILSGLTSVCGAVISAWEGVASAVSNVISRISAAVGSIQLPSFGGNGGGVGKAEGGFVSAETHFYAGEHGPEVVIPLSSSRRARALDLLEKTGAILGGETASFAGDELQPEPERDVFSDTFGVERPSEKLNIRRETQEILPNNTTVSTSTPTSTSNEVQLGGINVTFNVTGDNPDDILSTIREHLNEVTDSIAGKLSEQIQSVHMNQPLSEV